MQKNKQPTPSRHRPFYQLPTFWIICIIIIIITIVGIIFVPRILAKNQPAASPTAPTPTNLEAQKSKDTKSSETPQSSEQKDKTPSSDNKTPAKYDGEDPNVAETLSGIITTARFSGDKFILRINIDQYLSAGTCNLTLSDGTHQLSKTANLIPSASTSTCEGFDISSSELSNFAKPIYITINLISSDKTGIIEGKVE